MIDSYAAAIERHCRQASVSIAKDCLVEVIAPLAHVYDIARRLRNLEDLACNQLTDLCGIDYLGYGQGEWSQSSDERGYSRAKHAMPLEVPTSVPSRFAVVYHLLSTIHNHRVRLKVWCDESLSVPSVTQLWTCANWFEREAFDLFGIHFDGHPDMRRILTDYGFVGHPLRKDFPLIGELEMQYDAESGRCLYQPVSIEPRVSVPRTLQSYPIESTHE